ncbi:RING finger protein [Trichinella spiralis]|uniref:RING finger protein n=1 Tax=Trichinella spiralis TaxID=6334 RepID=A0ABR3KMI2_TRISP
MYVNKILNSTTTESPIPTFFQKYQKISSELKSDVNNFIIISKYTYINTTNVANEFIIHHRHGRHFEK